MYRRSPLAPQPCVQLSKTRVPVRAILIASLFSYGALAASVLSPDKVFNFLINSSGAIMLFIYLLIAWAQLRLRARFEAEALGELELSSTRPLACPQATPFLTSAFRRWRVQILTLK